MESEEQIQQSADEAELMLWDCRESVRPIGTDEVRFSRGFLRADASAWFDLSASWSPLFHVLGVQTSLVSTAQKLDFPDGLERLSVFEIEGERGVLGADNGTCNALVAAVAESEGLESQKSEIVLEYLERRLLSSVSSSWTGDGDLQFSYIPDGLPADVNISGVVSLQFKLQDTPCTLWFGLGPRAVENVDANCRSTLSGENSSS
ncbi:hypothetical protein BVY02_02625, partial [bacterium J17]